MTDKKKPSLPQGDFQWSTGSNYGLDSYSYDTAYGEGTANGPRPGGGDDFEHPQTRSMARLPDGIITADMSYADIESMGLEEDSGFSLSAFMQEGQEVELPDLTWVDPEQEQDLERLPYYDSDIINDMTRQWAQNLPKLGFALVPNVELDRASYERSLEGYEKSPSFLDQVSEKRRVAHVLQHALRLAHLSVSQDRIQREVEALVSPKESSSIMARVQEDYGLLGKVFIRASAFPGLEQGRWDGLLDRMPDARFLLVSSQHPLREKASFKGREVVQSLSWEDALQTYQSKWAGLGFQWLEKGSPKEILRTACLKGHVKQAADPTIFPLSEDWSRVDNLDSREALAFVQGLPKTREYVAPPLSVDQEDRARFAQSVVTLMRKGHLSSDQGQVFLRSSAPLNRLRASLREVLLEVQSAKTAAYRGDGYRKGKHQGALEALRNLPDSKGGDEPLVHALYVQRNRQSLAKFVEKGLLTPKQIRSLEGLPVREALERAMKLASGKIRPDTYPVEKKARYQGTAYEPFSGSGVREEAPSASRQLLYERAKQAGVKPSNIESVIKFARRQMTEGVCGKDLDQVLGLRFTKSLLQASDPFVRTARRVHEGLSGHLYVDAQVYASPKGTQGCDEGGLRHRADAIPYVKAMPRCASCVFHVNGGCQKYSKPLTVEVPVEDPKGYQAEAIRLANGSDAERTASLFVNNHEDPFGLRDPEMDTSSDEPMPSTDDLSVVWGWDV